MKSMLKKLFLSFIGSAMLVMFTAAGASAISVTVDGAPVSFDTEPVMINDRTMVPMRAIFEALGAGVSWDDTSKTAVSTRGETTISVSADSNVMKVESNGAVNEVQLDAPAVIIDGRTLVPVRAISEAFGTEVYWNAPMQRVEIGDHSRKVYFDTSAQYYIDGSRTKSLPSVLIDSNTVYCAPKETGNIYRYENGEEYAYSVAEQSASNLILYNGMIYYRDLWEGVERMNRDGSSVEMLYSGDDFPKGFVYQFFICDNKIYHIGMTENLITATVYDIASGKVTKTEASTPLSRSELEDESSGTYASNYRVAAIKYVSVYDDKLYVGIAVDVRDPEETEKILEIERDGSSSSVVSSLPQGAYIQECRVGGDFNGAFTDDANTLKNKENKVISQQTEQYGSDGNIILNYDDSKVVYYYFDWTDSGREYADRYRMIKMMNYDGSGDTLLNVWDVYDQGGPAFNASGQGSAPAGGASAGAAGACAMCYGSGRITCTYCHGSGYSTHAQIGIGGGIWEDTCPNCGGAGSKTCPACKGTGRL